MAIGAGAGAVQAHDRLRHRVALDGHGHRRRPACRRLRERDPDPGSHRGQRSRRRRRPSRSGRTGVGVRKERGSAHCLTLFAPACRQYAASRTVVRGARGSRPRRVAAPGDGRALAVTAHRWQTLASGWAVSDRIRQERRPVDRVPGDRRRAPRHRVRPGLRESPRHRLGARALREDPDPSELLRAVIVFDKRGTGLSDRTAGLPTLAERMDDIRAVMDAAGSERAAIVGLSEGGPSSMLFAATFPERTAALVLWLTAARPPLDERDEATQQSEHLDRRLHRRALGRRHLDALADLRLSRPTPATDDLLSRYERNAATPTSARSVFRRSSSSDVRPFLSSIGAPTLLIAHTGDPVMPIDAVRSTAARSLVRGSSRSRSPPTSVGTPTAHRTSTSSRSS